MDFRHPVSSLMPGSTGRILEVLGQSERDLNTSAVARLAGVSLAQASRVLPRLVGLGVASVRHVPPSSLYSLNRSNVSAHAVEYLLRSPGKIGERLRSFASRISPSPASLVLFGSAARGDASAESDLDVLVVRPKGVRDDDEEWNTSLADWSDRVHSFTGNRVSLLEVDEDEIAERFTADSAIWQDILREGVTVSGRDLRAYAPDR